ncbi:MAG: MBL fold metallo-hydrolase [Candidatus Krumholzibacteria bacterium]|nr:MBL fold metallo-hydrolase [Candidatus Krumholzibacteria bacterium]
MKLRYLGHAAFELELTDGRRIVFDPYESGSYDGALAYGPIAGSYDIAVVSHDHPDHRFEGVVSQAAAVWDGAGETEIDGVRITSIPTFHDETRGSERGTNLISIVEADGVRVAHLGDLGHAITKAEVPALEGVDVMIIPVGGYFTIDAAAAKAIVEEFLPKIVVPMHYKTGKCGFPIAPVDDFTMLMGEFDEAGGSELDLAAGSLPTELKVVVLDPAL